MNATNHGLRDYCEDHAGNSSQEIRILKLILLSHEILKKK